MKGPPRVRGAEELCERLDRSVVGEDDLPAGSFYAAAGWGKDGIQERIRKEMAAAFPNATPPNFGLPETAAVAYAYMEAGVKFAIPFFESRKPLAFKDSSGKVTEVTSFGLRQEDEFGYGSLRAQVEVLLAGDRSSKFEFRHFSPSWPGAFSPKPHGNPNFLWM